MYLYTAQAMREVDQRAVELGYPGLLLMEAAGRAVADAVQTHFPQAQRIVVLCGPGNNGGDGLVAARWLKQRGYQVRVYASEESKGDSLIMQRALEVQGLPVQPLKQVAWSGAHLVVDALFGTGLSRPLTGGYANLVEAINKAELPILSVDVPSGLPFNPHILADFTLVLAGLKHEHMFYPSRAACGKMVLDTILMPAEALQAPGLPELLEPSLVQTLLPKRPGNAHKGNVGQVLVMGGYPSYRGAPVLSALGAYRAGAGLVTLAYPAGVAVQAPLEVVHQPLEKWKPEFLTPLKADAIAVGMGCGPAGEDAAIAALEQGKPTVLDADALHPDVLEAYKRSHLPFVITPHPGEAGRLLDMTAAEVLEDPLASARQLAELYHCTAVLKGGPSILAQKNGETIRLTVNTTGNAAMAAGGMGDVLSGVIAAFLASGQSGWDAARAGVYLHGLAGDQVGRIGMLAHELAEALPGARAALEEGQVKAFWE